MPPRSSRAGRAILVVALAVTLAALLLHARAYSFLTDDAFISFRYARNLSHGHGLVFNPGGERVEGYSNFLWVLLLAGLDRLGLAPERVANALGFALTALLWGLLVWLSWRSHRRLSWAILVPAMLLAATREVAVWATSGLETRCFEVLVVAAIARLLVELEALRSRERPRAAWAPLLFALASLTRPDGILVSACAAAVAAWSLWRWRSPALPRFAAAWLGYAVLVGGHFIFRRAYYHEWLPNTYYAKVGGRLWWSAGFEYAAVAALEYAAYLWVPLLALAVMHHRRRRTGHVPLLLAGILIPHLLYVVAIGGDHFEYRPLDLYFPLLFLLLADGAMEWASRPRRGPIMAAYLGLVLVGIVELPLQSHREFPPRYITGFPGQASVFPEAAAFLDPARDPVYRLPGLRTIATAHRALLGRVTSRFAGLRQEEHRLFAEDVILEGLWLQSLVRDGRLPADMRIAMGSVGAIPYYSGIWTLDRMGLTDAHVAHSPFVSSLVAHGKMATLEYARERAVDLWALHPVFPLLPVGSFDARILGTPDSTSGGTLSPGGPLGRVYAADAGPAGFLIGALPMGIERARQRMPRLEFEPLGDSSLVRAYFARSAALDSTPHSP